MFFSFHPHGPPLGARVEHTSIMEEMLNNMKQIMIIITPKITLISQTIPIREIKMGPERNKSCK